MDVYSLLKRLAQDEVKLLWLPGSKTVILAVISEKGGVGKTATVTGLAAVAAMFGLKVMVVDLDPRATATAELGIETPSWSVNDLLWVDPADDDPADITGAAAEALLPAGQEWPGTIKVLASERALGNREIDNVTPALEQRLNLALQGVADDFDLVLMDVPPRAGGKLTSSAFLAATHGLLPATLDEDGYIGARDAMVSIKKMRPYNTGFQVVGVARSVVDRRPTGLAKLYDAKMAEEFGDLYLPDVAVPRYVVRQESRSACLPFTAVTSPETTLLQRGYVGVLNAVWEKAK